MEKQKRGLVQVYTGNGKGKTTAALGQALRALGHGYKVMMVQFMKGSKNYGELQAVEKNLPDFVIIQSGRHDFVNKQNPEKIDIDLARQGLSIAREAVVSGSFDMLILDEINVALDFGLIPLAEVLELIVTRPVQLDLILTGRYAHGEILAVADLVSEVQEAKHHYASGVQAREGIEF
ncbi:MAG: cob(I)yrinic acid a,c-diamide adenosyltransferase [Bacillota bacterium]